MKNTLKQGTIYLTLSSLIFIITGYFINILLGRFLGPVLYGSYGVIISLISLVNVIQTSGLTQSAAKYIAEDESISDEIFKSAFNIQIGSTVLITLLFFVMAHPLAFLLHDSSLAQYIQLAALIFPIYGYYALLIDYYNGRHYFKNQATLNILYSVTKTVAVLLLGYLFQLKGVIFGLIFASLVPILNGFYYPKSVKFHFPYKKLLLFSLPLIGYIIFSTLLQSIDLYFVKSLLAGEAPGYYTASQNISRLVYFGTIAISSVLLPSISKSVRENLQEKIKTTINMALRTALLVIVPGILIISATSKQLVILIYSHLYAPASLALAILVIGIGFFTLFTILCSILNGGGNPKLSFLLALLGVGINSLFCLLLIPTLNIQGAAIASLISNVVVTVLAAIFVYRRFQQLIFLGSFIKIFCTSIVIYLLAGIIHLPSIILPLLYIFLFALYIVLLILLKEITREDITMVRSLLPQWMAKKGKI